MSFPEQRLRVGRWPAASIVLVLAIAIFSLATDRLGRRPRIGMTPEFSVRLPVPAQVLMSVGDRHLAANLGGFRVLVAETARMRAEDYAIQARLQKDISRLNPAHEDNYYIAAAILPWGGQLEAAQYVLKRAADARPFDYQPLFYYGFHLYHFFRNPAAGAEALLAGASRARDPQDQWALQNVAAIWIERGYLVGEAAGRVQAMANSAPPGSFRKYLAIRATRLRELDRLGKLAATYEQTYGRKPSSLEELIQVGLIERIPVDPLGVGFALDASGEPVFRDALGKRR
ncbi:MAG: hypothetical protein HZB40_19245 [Rhodocyclales bacterium]|nr:hypothetical protein [Rhodocyclales bacterium]